MGFLPEERYRATLPDLDDETSLETGEVGHQGNVRETSALPVGLEAVEVERGTRRVEELRARYGTVEIPVELGAWQRQLGAELLGRRHSWARQECHAKDDRIAEHDHLVLAEYPFAGRRRYEHATFRPALRKQKKPYFGEAFVARLEEARQQHRDDLPTLALELLEDVAVVPLDPFNTGHKRIAASSLPPAPFGEELGDYARQGGQGAAGRTGWALGTCRDAKTVHEAVQRELYELVEREAAQQAKAERQRPDGRLRFATPPKGSKASPLRLTGDVPDKADLLLPHAAWLAMAGPGPKESMPRDRSVAAVAFRRLDELLYNLQRRVSRKLTEVEAPEDW